MSGALQVADGGGGPARCVRCGATAAGPCARCGAPVCGDCCVLTEGGTRTWAICLACDRRGGRSLWAGWVAAIVWIAIPIAALAVLVGILALAGRR